MIQTFRREIANDNKARRLSADVGNQLLPGTGKEGEMESPLRLVNRPTPGAGSDKRASRQDVESRRRTLRTIVGSESRDIITRDKYRDFELKLEWKIAPGGNSGIIYLVSEDFDQNMEHGA